MKRYYGGQMASWGIIPPIIQTAQQGWQCPICESVYAPWVAKCESCGEGKKPEMANEQ